MTETKTIRGIKAKKSLGQNFLFNRDILRRIVAAGEPQANEIVVEVGPGKGNLTEELLASGVQVTAVEKDRRLITELREKFAGQKFSVTEADALDWSPAKKGIADDGYKVIANIPYYITGQLLRNIFEKWPRPKLVVLLVQKEVAQRISARPPHANQLSLSVQYFATPKMMGHVSRRNFTPVPGVDSTIIRLTPYHTPHDPEDTAKMFQVIHAGFSAKRKQLANNLADGFKLSKERIAAFLVGAGIKPTARAENLTLEQWSKLTKLILL